MEKKPPKQMPKTIEECLERSLIKIKKYFKRVETNNFSIPLNGPPPDVSDIPNQEKAFFIIRRNNFSIFSI